MWKRGEEEKSVIERNERKIKDALKEKSWGSKRRKKKKMKEIVEEKEDRKRGRQEWKKENAKITEENKANHNNKNDV